jgi:hypothetical protein
MSIKDNGNVGIGLTNPQGPLHVVGQIIYGTLGASSLLQSDGANNSVINAYSGHVFQCGGTEKVRIDASGNVGVGTSTPGATFDVVGVTRSTSFVGNGIIPIGGIIMWSGTIANIPSGWALCNGTNSTPDLRNRFIIGATADVSSVPNTSITTSNTVTGGTKDAIVVSHTHTITDPGHKHTQGALEEFPNNGRDTTRSVRWRNNSADLTANPPFTYDATTGIVIDSAGVTGTNANLPPYYALAFIMRTA